ncbi:hypothetical protein PHLGIDRAFT_124365 [Phlebiopsis gigantea 11061_1 CR5-6]|uniref:C2H2-type domain-containing protein n=1 Tax=Phlebiopsis gigantea (strain 11061_1 CR5-6) TaxID=745531 RepID=A0A0C3P2S1_PHLG1|nr:hypothetical protein PHLGIDRAFT_124365 [Phlebiopsis gigantea 11061_1 CR5-6]
MHATLPVIGSATHESEWDLIQHFAGSSAHVSCQQCRRHFDHDEHLTEHYEYDHRYCRDCNEIHEHSLQEHDRQEHHYCVPCRSSFQRLDCARAFVTNAHLIAHWESGACRSGVTRHSIDRFAIQADGGGVITDAARLIAHGDGATSGRPRTRGAYECVLCHRAFRTLGALNAHLRSPAHAARIYKCPNVFDGCGVQCSTLSGLVQHVESECCGVQRFRRQVDPLMDNFTGGMRSLTAD